VFLCRPVVKAPLIPSRWRALSAVACEWFKPSYAGWGGGDVCRKQLWQVENTRWNGMDLIIYKRNKSVPPRAPPNGEFVSLQPAAFSARPCRVH